MSSFLLERWRRGYETLHDRPPVILPPIVTYIFT